MLNLNAQRTFACPNCTQIINEDSQQCAFCRTPIDRQAAAASADIQDKASASYSDAGFLRTTAVAAIVFALLNIIPFLGLVYFIILIIGIILFVRWQIKFGFLKTNDADYLKAGRTKNISLAVFVASFFLFIVVAAVRMAVIGG